MKHLEIALICTLIPFLILSLVMDESPRWLLTVGRVKQAKKIISKILRINKLPPSNVNEIKASEEKKSKLTLMDILRQRGMRRNLLLLCVYWFATSMGTYGLVFYTPTFDWNPYLVFVFPSLLNIPMASLNPFLENK